MYRSTEDWESISQKVYYISNDTYTITNLATEVIWLGELDIMIDEYCTIFEGGKAPIQYGSRITMLSRLFIIHAYEIIRCLDEFDQRRKPTAGGNLANFKTNHFKMLKGKLEKIRVPLVKLEKKGISESSFININGGGRNICFTSQEGDQIFMNQIIQEIYDTINNYTRNPI